MTIKTYAVIGVDEFPKELRSRIISRCEGHGNDSLIEVCLGDIDDDEGGPSLVSWFEANYPDADPNHVLIDWSW